MTNDNIKVKDGKYICTLDFYPGTIRIPGSELENFLFLKTYREHIETDITYDYGYCYYRLRLASQSLTNLLRTRFEIINYYVKTT